MFMCKTYTSYLSSIYTCVPAYLSVGPSSSYTGLSTCQSSTSRRTSASAFWCPHSRAAHPPHSPPTRAAVPPLPTRWRLRAGHHPSSLGPLFHFFFCYVTHLVEIVGRFEVFSNAHFVSCPRRALGTPAIGLE